MKNLKSDFPFFDKNDLVYCDSAATSHKPQSVIDRLVKFYSYENAPVHRGLYTLAEKATEQFEEVREEVKDFIGASDASEIVFTHGATEGINMVVKSWARHNLKEGDEIVLTELEHHANILPWQQLALEKKLIINYIPITSDGDLDYSKLEIVITAQTKVVAVASSSNVTGGVIDVDRIAMVAHSVGARLVVDASQSAPRTKLSVSERGFDFLVFSSHKVLGPTGLGVLFVKKELHPSMAPYIFGGGMVFSVTSEKSVWREMPYRCEAGTPPIAQVIGFGASLRYLKNNVDFDKLKKHEAALCSRLLDGLAEFEQVKILGPINKLRQSGHIVSFVVEGMHAHDVAVAFDQMGIIVRAGHHCAQPLHEKLGVSSSVRVSFYLYNTVEDVEKILIALKRIIFLF